MTFSERTDISPLEYAIIVVLWQVVQKLCIGKKVDIPWSIYRDFTASNIF